MDAVLNESGEAPLQVSGADLVPLPMPRVLHAERLCAVPELLALTISAPVGNEAALKRTMDQATPRHNQGAKIVATPPASGRPLGIQGATKPYTADWRFVCSLHVRSAEAAKAPQSPRLERA